ncbi:MAG: hypothetical protein FWH27_05420 [Planctomycetaceae bacterium]|nr:hypothetical protein [Planctomycetaceae bacterium]
MRSWEIWRNLAKIACRSLAAIIILPLTIAPLITLFCIDASVWAESLDQLEIVFDDDFDGNNDDHANNDVDEPVFVEADIPATPLQSRTGGPPVNSGITNAAYIAVVPNAGGGTQYVTPANGIVFPQAYWNGNTSGNPIRLASATLDDSLDTTGTLSTGIDTQFGSIPSGTPVVLLAQSPPYAPVDSLSPATNPAAANPALTGPYSLPPSGYPAASTYDPNYRSALSERYDRMISFMDNVTVHALWMPSGGSKPLGNTELRGQTRFAMPCQMMGNTMFYVAPAFQVNFWGNPPKSPQYAYSMRDTTFGAWLDAGIEPQLGNEFRFDLWGSVGVYSDFNKITSDCIYVRGLARGYYQYSNTCELMLGVHFLNRERIKLMPAFGIIWAPSNVLECHFIFPEPKILRHIYTVNDTQWWAFVRADYGGGSWAVNTGQGVFRTDYNDIRVALGLEFRNKPKQCLSGYFEVGGAFNRELYSDGQSWYKPGSCVFLAGGLKY